MACFTRVTEYSHDLASIHGSGEDAAVAALCSGQKCWIGGSDAAREGTWTWSDGTAWNYDNWRSHQPDDSNTEDCLEFGPDDTWNDASCDAHQPFVCATVRSTAGGGGKKKGGGSAAAGAIVMLVGFGIFLCCCLAAVLAEQCRKRAAERDQVAPAPAPRVELPPVSYTHLTLPTKA